MKTLKNFTILVLVSCLILQCSPRKTNEDNLLISVEEYQKAVYASWIGQIIGNTYGLGYEFKFIDRPGPDKFPYGYSFTIDDLKKYNGAYSDDDTDIEYMYLNEMEKNGIEPTYYQLADAWKTHVKERIWFANRMAVTLMHAGHYPPVTGAVGYNAEWFQIDPQLINEIWAITAPGMIDYAVEKTRFAAHIISDSFGLEPTIHYAAMYSAAFVVKDVNKLIDIGTSKLPANSRFAKIVEDVKVIYSQNPDNWQKARAEVVKKYYVYSDYNRHSWAAVDANLNGALGIMALLYGKGDFYKTLDYACGLGMDADNQAATMCGLLGIVHGFDSIPHSLMFPLNDRQWEKPFNDSYKMVTREGLNDAAISDIARRCALQGEKIILAHGGKIVQQHGKKYYNINPHASFIAPFELNPIPPLSIDQNKPFTYPLYTGGITDSVAITVKGLLPAGIALVNHKLTGIPTTPGNYPFKIRATCQKHQIEIEVLIKVTGQNLAPLASKVIFNTNANDQHIEIIRDGDTRATYYSHRKSHEQVTDFYGYQWNEPIDISEIHYNTGAANEWGGWFTTFSVEYLSGNNWQTLPEYSISPALNLDNSQWLKPSYMEYVITFPTMRAKGIRIIGKAGGIEKDAANAHLGMEYFTGISELKIFK